MGEWYPAQYLNKVTICLRLCYRESCEGSDHPVVVYYSVNVQEAGTDRSVPGPEDWSSENFTPKPAAFIQDFRESVRPTPSTGKAEKIPFAPVVFQELMPDTGLTFMKIASIPPFCPISLSSPGIIDSTDGRTKIWT